MYCTVLDVRMALTPGADSGDSSTASGLADNQILDAIGEADGHINGYVANLYKIPEITIQIPGTGENPVDVVVSVAPIPVRWWSRDIAAYLATLTYKRNKNVPEDDPVRLRYNLVMGMLQRVASGDYRLPFEPADPIGSEANSGVFVHNQYEGRLFGAEDFFIHPAGASYQQDLGWNRRI